MRLFYFLFCILIICLFLFFKMNHLSSLSKFGQSFFIRSNLELFLRANSFFLPEGSFTLISSLRLFWPDAKLLLILDSESPEDRAAGSRQAALWSPLSVRIVYDEPYSGPGDPILGKKRMYYDMFFADMFSEAEYVGFLDTDTLFTTWVTRDSIFEGEKPRIICALGPAYNSWWAAIPLTTSFVLGETALLWCMTYFPVIVARVDLFSLRQHIEQVHGMDFTSVFQAANRIGEISQFDIIGNYLWKYKRDSYSWHFQTIPPNLLLTYPTPPEASTVSDVFDVMNQYPTFFRPIVRVAIHGGWYSSYGKFHLSTNDSMHKARKALLYPGICIAILSQINSYKQSIIISSVSTFCRGMYPHKFPLLSHLFHFESIGDDYGQRNWTWDLQGCIQAQSIYLDTLAISSPLLNEIALMDILN